MSIFINRFKKVLPRHLVQQDELLQWIIACHQKAESLSVVKSELSLDMIEKFFKRYAVKSNQISQRYVECSDILNSDFSKAEVYKMTEHQPEGSSIKDRAQYYLKRTDEVFKEIYLNNLNPEKHPSHIIHTTCTGYVSPSSAQKIVVHPEWKGGTEVTHAYHMGCYAAMPSVRTAEGLVSTSRNQKDLNYRVDIVHNEMCGLHMNPLAHSPEQIVVQTLFADGHIKYSLSKEKLSAGKNFKILALVEKVIPDSEQDMSWIPNSWGMQMNLSRDVPEKIKQHLQSFNKILIEKAELQPEQFMSAKYAIHPGGPKIIDAISEAMELNLEQTKESRNILLTRGNMSSATLPHVWEQILENNYPVGTFVVSYAFGPGLTMYGSVLEVC